MDHTDHVILKIYEFFIVGAVLTNRFTFNQQRRSNSIIVEKEQELDKRSLIRKMREESNLRMREDRCRSS